MEETLYKAVIVDDEVHALLALETLISKEFSHFDVIETFTDPVAALSLLKNCAIDVLFLDVSMPKMDGFGFLSSLEKIDFDLVFVTAFDHYAIRAIKWSCLDYLLKPVSAKDIDHLLVRLAQRRKERSVHINYLKELLKPQPTLERLMIPSVESIEIVDIKDVKFIEAQNNYVRVHLKNGSFISSTRHLKSYDELFEECHAPFFRIHQSFLINLNFVSAFLRGNGGFVRLTTGEEIPLARRKRDAFLKLLKTRAS